MQDFRTRPQAYCKTSLANADLIKKMEERTWNRGDNIEKKLFSEICTCDGRVVVDVNSNADKKVTDDLEQEERV